MKPRDDIDDAKQALVTAFKEFGDNALRDVWLFDQSSHEPLYLRDDIQEKLMDVDVSKHIDNERYGYVIRDTYNLLYYADYEYTVRGFTEFEQFRAFISDSNDRKIGVLSSLDQTNSSYDFEELYQSVEDVVSTHSDTEFKLMPAAP